MSYSSSMPLKCQLEHSRHQSLKKLENLIALHQQRKQLESMKRHPQVPFSLAQLLTTQPQQSSLMEQMLMGQPQQSSLMEQALMREIPYNKGDSVSYPSTDYVKQYYAEMKQRSLDQKNLIDKYKRMRAQHKELPDNYGKRLIAQYLASQGRDGDTELVHVNKQEEAILKAMGGSGSINPKTGLREYFRTWEIGDNDAVIQRHQFPNNISVFASNEEQGKYDREKNKWHQMYDPIIPQEPESVYPNGQNYFKYQGKKQDSNPYYFGQAFPQEGNSCHGQALSSMIENMRDNPQKGIAFNPKVKDLLKEYDFYKSQQADDIPPKNKPFSDTYTAYKGKNAPDAAALKAVYGKNKQMDRSEGTSGDSLNFHLKTLAKKLNIPESNIINHKRPYDWKEFLKLSKTLEEQNHIPTSWKLQDTLGAKHHVTVSNIRMPQNKPYYAKFLYHDRNYGKGVNPVPAGILGGPGAPIKVYARNDGTLVRKKIGWDDEKTKGLTLGVDTKSKYFNEIYSIKGLYNNPFEEENNMNYFDAIPQGISKKRGSF